MIQNTDNISPITKLVPFLILSAASLFIPILAYAHGGAMSAEEAMRENIIIGLVASIVIAGVVWFIFFRKK